MARLFTAVDITGAPSSIRFFLRRSTKEEDGYVWVFILALNESTGNSCAGNADHGKLAQDWLQ
eukprot:7644385-Pyramimonas_sp.AAC.1